MAYPTLLHEEKVGFPAVHIESGFLAPIRYGDTPEFHVGVKALGTSSASFGIWATKDGDGSLLYWALVTTVAVDMDSMTKLPEIPSRWRRKLEGYMLSAGEFPGRPF